jgi:hypothetical protein
MQRVFTKPIGKNFLKGDIRDYPISVWRDIARSAKEELDHFSTAVMSPDQPQMLNPELVRKK